MEAFAAIVMAFAADLTAAVPVIVISFVVLSIWHVMGVSIGYHRLLTHRSFVTFKPVEYFWVIGGYLALEGSPIWWACMHRAHHRYADTELDPHTPRYGGGGWVGIKHAFNGWLGKKEYPPHLSPAKQCTDLIHDPLYKYLEADGDLRKMSKRCVVLNVLFRFVLLAIFGWLLNPIIGVGVFVGSFAAGVVGHVLPLGINVLCHMYGYRNFNVKDDSTNLAWYAYITGGEAWHNNHHAHPGSARFGLRWYELDSSWFVIKLMRAVGLITRLQEAKGIHEPLKPMEMELDLQPEKQPEPV
jgi:Fatty-acid desaturase